MPPNNPSGIVLGSHHSWLAEYMVVDGYHFRTQSRGKLSAKFLKNHESEIVEYIGAQFIVTKEGFKRLLRLQQYR